MQQTLKHIAIFILFLLAVLLWEGCKGWLQPYFRFAHGQTALLLFWSTGVVILFHVLYHYLGKCSDKVVYVLALAALVAMGILVSYHKLALR
ncbi:MAG: hypothetical protein V1918_06860 [Planctomycetota bacterium]